MEVKLVVRNGKHSGQVIPVGGPQFVIGRGPDCHLRPNHKDISTHHCAILVEQGRVAVRDMNSATGTYVNDARIKDEQDLRNGDRLRVGPLEFDVHLTVGIGGKKKPAIRSIQEAAARTVAKASGSEMDVAAWLSEPETKKKERPAAAAKEEQPDHVAQDDEKLFGHQKQVKPAAASSRDAAAETLRQMFKK